MNHCIFCVSLCPPNSVFVGGQLKKLKSESWLTASQNYIEPSSSPLQDSTILFPGDSVVAEQLWVIFILRKILKVGEEQLVNFLESSGNLHPENWLSVCSSCGETVKKYYETLREIGRLEKKLGCYSEELKGHIRRTKEAESEGATGIIWETIRNKFIEETESANDFEEFNIESVMVSTLETEDSYGETDMEDASLAEPIEDEPLIKIEPPSEINTEYVEEEEDDDSTFHPDSPSDSNHQHPKRRRRNGKAGEFGCSACTKLFDSETRLKTHYRTHHQATLCKLCGKTFGSLKNLRGHRERVHTPKGSFSCPTCSKVFPTPYNLYRHRKRNHDDRQQDFPCPTCSEVFDSSVKLWRHKRSTHEWKPYCCSNCGRNFKTDTGLSYHVNTVHKPAPLPCSHCQIMFRHKQNLKRHLRKKHSDPKTVKLPPSRQEGEPIPCQTCGKLFSTSEKVTAHIRRVHGEERFSCAECNVVVKTKKQLSTHIQAVHNPETHICQVCGKTFGTVKYVKEHMTRYHPTPAQKASWVKCPKCDKSFYQNYQLKRHLLRSACQSSKSEETPNEAQLW